MYEGRRVLAVVPARGGSKGIPKKNLQKVGGVSLVGRTGDLLQCLPWIDRAVVSTDSDEIAREAEIHGLSAPFLRPAELSGDRIGDFEVLEHALLAAEKEYGTTFDLILMVQPTSPFRKREHLEGVVQELVRGSFDTVWTVTEVDVKHHPLKQLKNAPDGGMALWSDEGRRIIARQQLEPTYIRNGAGYVFTRDCLMKQRSIYGTRMGKVIVCDPLVNIDTVQDLEYANHLIREGKSLR